MNEHAIKNVQRWFPTVPVGAAQRGAVVWAFATGSGAEQVDRRPLLPARYEAIGAAGQCAESSSERTPRHRRRGDRERRREHGLGRNADRAREKIDNTKHVWGLIALIYAYAALFALVVALDVFGD